MAHTIGIDFGTTKTMVSYLNPATGRPELVRLGRDRDSVPTTIHVDEAGAFLFGEDADDLIETDPEGYCRAFKLQLGEMDPVLLRAGQTAEALAARFLHYVKKECEQTVFHGEPIDTATLTIPVVFSPARKASLERAANAAGFSSVSFLPEPEAAGKAFLRDNPADKFTRAVVLDWGGDTLDIAMISRDQEGGIHADRQCAGGRDDIGGEEMDRLLLGKIDELWSEKYGINLFDSMENESQLLREAEKTKIFLSRKETTVFRQGPKTIAIPRALFNQLVEPFVSAAVDLIRNALAKNGAKGEAAPDALLLIGGTSLLSVVRETMEKEFPELRVLSWHHSHEAVALGASRGESVSQSSQHPFPPPPVREKAGPTSSEAASPHFHESSNTGSTRKVFVASTNRVNNTGGRARPIRIVVPKQGTESVPATPPPHEHGVGFVKAWKRKWSCWERNGRATRSEYWWGALACFIEENVVMLLGNGISPLFWIWLGISLYPTLCQEVRRLHDTGHSGKWVLSELILVLIMLISPDNLVLVLPALLACLVTFIVKLLPSTKGPNQYGEQP